MIGGPPMTSKNIFAAVLDKIRAANDALVADGVLPAGNAGAPWRNGRP